MYGATCLTHIAGCCGLVAGAWFWLGVIGLKLVILIILGYCWVVNPFCARIGGICLLIERIERLCLSKGVTVNKMSEDINVDASTITGWRKGSNPRPNTLKKVADYLETSIEYLLTGDETDAIEPAIQSAFYTKIESLCNEKGVSVAKMITENGLGTGTAPAWKRGAKPRPETLKRIADYFAVPVSYFDETDTLTKQETELLRIFNTLDVRRQARLLIFALGLESASEYDTSEDVEPAILRPLPLYHLKASAGPGVFLDNADFSVVGVSADVPLSATFGVRIDGDSMEPRYPDKYIAWVRRAQSVDIGQVGIFFLNGDGFIKKMGRGELISMNPQYAPIPIAEYDEFRVYGSVVAVTEDVY